MWMTLEQDRESDSRSCNDNVDSKVALLHGSAFSPCGLKMRVKFTKYTENHRDLFVKNGKK